MKKKTIVFFTDTYVVGGAEFYLLRLIRGLDKQKYSIVFIRYDLEELRYLDDELKGTGARIVLLPTGSFLKSLRILRKNFAAADLIHLNFLNPNRCKFPLILSFLFPHTKVIGTLHLSMAIESHYPLKPQIMRILLSLMYKRLSAMICVSKQNREFFCKHYWFDTNHCAAIYNGIDIEKYKVPIDRTAIRTELGLNDDDIAFVNVARICEQKGQRYLIAAAKRVVSQFPNAKFLLVGDGEMKKTIQEEIDANNLQENIRILGFREDIPRILQASDCMVLPSIREGFPFVVLEAMATGLPVIASAVNGVPEAVEDNVNGFLIPPRDVDALTDRLERVMGNKNILFDFRQSCLSKIDQFTFSKMVKETEQVFDAHLT